MRPLNRRLEFCAKKDDVFGSYPQNAVQIEGDLFFVRSDV